MPTIQVEEALQHPASSHQYEKTSDETSLSRRSNAKVFFMEVHPVIRNIYDLEQHSLEGFTCHKSNDCLLFYRLELEEETQIQKILESIKLDSYLHAV